MKAKPVVFVSAVSSELHFARELVAKTLRFLGFDPVFQEEFGSPTGVVRGMLEKKLDSCAAVIQIVGHRYGNDLYDALNPSECMSYTHYEASYAHRNELPIWYLIISDGYAVDSPNDEDPEKKVLQSAYRIRVQRTGHIYYNVADAKDIELTVFRMLKDLDELRPTPSRWIGNSNEGGSAEAGSQAPPASTKASKAELEHMMRSLFNEFFPVLQQAREPRDAGDETRREADLYARLGTMLGVPPNVARREIKDLATRLRANRKESLSERAKAAYTLEDFAKAEELALGAAQEAALRSPPDTVAQLKAFELAARAAVGQRLYARALGHSYDAAAFTDEKRDPIEWSRVQYLIVNVLEDQHEYHKATEILRSVVDTRQRVLGPEHHATPFNHTRILIVKPSALGDIILALPAVRILRRAYPRAHIAWLIDDHLASLLDGCPIIDRVIPFARRRMGQLSGFPETMRFARSLREEGFDWAVDFQCLLRSALLSRLSGARRLTGLSDGREGSTLFYNEIVKLPSPPAHYVDRYLMLPRVLGLEVDRVEFPLGGETVSQREPLIVINPGTRWTTKQWSSTRFSTLLDVLAAHWPDHRIALIGSMSERSMVESIAAAAKTKVEMLAGKSTLPELIRLMRRARLLISNDTAPMHLAVAVGTPVVAIFGPTDPRLTGPYPPGGANNVVLQSRIECSPCFKPYCTHQPELECMTRIEVGQVVDATQRLMSKT